jgi:predicted ABC-type ATPase
MSNQPPPTIYVIGGPNGAGKTTFAWEFLPSARVIEFLNADLLAAGLSPFEPGAMTIKSGRLLLTRWKELVKLRREFAFESTLSGKTYVCMLRQAKAAGFKICLCYLWLPTVNISLHRVRQRVRKGGHDILEADLRRRFLPSLENFFKLYLPLADQTLLFNGAGNPPQLIAKWQDGNLSISDNELYERIKKQIEGRRQNT